MILVDKRLDKATAPHLLWVIFDRSDEFCPPVHVRCALKAEVNPSICDGSTGYCGLMALPET